MYRVWQFTEVRVADVIQGIVITRRCGGFKNLRLSRA